MSILLISGSLNPESNSRILVRSVEQALQVLNVDTQLLDLRDYPLPFCDGDAAYNDPRVDELSAIIGKANAVLIGIPVYNFDINAAVKNLVELTGSAWENQVVGFLCAAGGRSSYMSVMNFANDLMLDFRCLIIPRFIYAVGNDFSGDVISNPDIQKRIQQLAQEAKQLAAYRQSIRS
jgi:FMN reductase